MRIAFRCGVWLVIVTTAVSARQARGDDPTPPSTGPVATLDGLGAFENPPSSPPAPGVIPPNVSPHYGPFDTIVESLFGPAYAEPSTWHPLPLSTLFTEGWDEAYVNPPAGTGGAPRSGWINSFDGNFFRAWFVVFAYQHDLNNNGDGFFGMYSIYAPLNRRFEFRVDVPFLLSNRAGPNNAYHTGVGDITVGPRLLLSATQNVTQLLAMNIRTPTGDALNGSGINSLGPQYQFWANPFGGWAVRGGTGVTVPTGQGGGRTLYNLNVAAGHYWKGQEDGWLRHFWLYLAANMNTPIAGTGPNHTFLGLTPGMRTQITGYWFFLAGVEVPVIGPQAYQYAPIFLILKDY